MVDCKHNKKIEETKTCYVIVKNAGQGVLVFTIKSKIYLFCT